MRKALALLSGGLDSSLAAWLVKNQGVKVKGLIFRSAFFNEKKGLLAAKQLKLPYQVVDFSREHLKLVKNPQYGYGKAANPCVDCHLLMLKKAKKILKKEKFDFVITGEVLGQRPFSQNKQAMALIAQKSGLDGLLVRPLSARHLPLTIPEKRGWLDRKKLLAIKGRSRKEQIALAKKIGLSYPQPAGGCILTETGLAKKLFLLKKKKPYFDENDALLLPLGRHFWQNSAEIIIGKNQEENISLEKLARPKDRLIQPANFSGPTALIRAKRIGSKEINKAKELILSFSKKKPVSQSVLFFGSSKESVEVLKIVLKNKLPVKGVITQPDRPAGRGKKLTPTPLGRFCQENNILTFKWERLDKESLEKTKKALNNKPALGIVAVYGNFIPPSWLNSFSILINLHPSLLPKWRGAAPVIRSLEAGDKETGITVFKIVKEMDAGPIIYQKKVRIKPNETAGELTERLFLLGADQISKMLRSTVISQKPEFWLMIPQDQSRATLAPKIDKAEAEIDWRESDEKIINKIRAFNPFPGAFTFVRIKGQKLRLKIWQVHLKEGKILPDQVQLEGKKRTSWKQFSLAYPTLKLPPCKLCLI